jgi:hypothetical protein
MADTVTLKHGEKKILKFTYTQDGVALPITGATLTLTVKEKIADTTPIMTKADSDFSKAANIARVNIDTSPLGMDKEYACEIKAIFSATSLDKSETFSMIIERSVDGE